MTTTEITVPVPSERVPEFYRWFANWIDDEGSSIAPDFPAVPATDALAAAVRWWKLLKLRERQIFGLWAEASPRMLTSVEIVEALGLNGPRDIPGILSWTSRKGDKVGFGASWNFRSDPITNGSIYGIENADYADLILRARSAAETE